MIDPRTDHLSAAEVASYIDGSAAPDARSRLDAHLGDCHECRDEVVEASRISASRGSRTRSPALLWLPGLAAAALLLLFARPGVVDQSVEHREAPVTAIVFPRALAPAGLVDSLTTLVWTSVPNADRYQVRLFTADATVLWQHTTTDTLATVPRTVPVRRMDVYHWSVEAHKGFDRAAASELTRFSVRFARQ